MRSARSGQVRVQLHFPKDEPTRTKQQFKDECNINNIMAKYQRTGVLEHLSKHGASYGDVPALDYHEAQNQIAQANSMFADLPSGLRKRFNNDPGQFLDFVQDEGNQEEAVKLGLAKPRPMAENPTPPRRGGTTIRGIPQPRGTPRSSLIRPLRRPFFYPGR